MRKRFASMFRSMSDWLDPRKPRDVTASLSDAEIRALKDLSLTDEWDIYVKALDIQQTLIGENIIVCTQNEVLHQSRGHVLGLRDAASLIQRIVDAHEEGKKNDERRRSAIERADDPKLTATYGSPYWAGVRGERRST